MSDKSGHKWDVPLTLTIKRKRPYEAFRDYVEPMLSESLKDPEIRTDIDVIGLLRVPYAIWNFLYIDKQIGGTILEDYLDSKFRVAPPHQWLSYVFLKERRKELLKIYPYKFTSLEVQFDAETREVKLLMKARK